MSGPKSSRYTLTEERRRLLAEQRRIEQQKHACVSKIRRCADRTARLRSSILEADEFLKQIKRIGLDDIEICEEIRRLDALLSSVTNQTYSATDATLDELESTYIKT